MMRRLKAALCALAAPLLFSALVPMQAAEAQAAEQAAPWPTRPVRFLYPYGAGGSGDSIMRTWADALGMAFNQPFVSENRGGASGAIGVEAGAKFPADGYNFLLSPNGPISLLPHLRKVNYDIKADLVPIARMGDLVCGFVVDPKLPIYSIKDLVAYAKVNPGKLAYGSAGIATATHTRLEMLKLRAGIDILHVPYRGSADALNDLLAGQVQLMNETIALPHVKAGKLRLLNINYPERNPDFPDVPTLTEAGYPDSDVPIWVIIFGPKGTSPDIVKRLNDKIVQLAKTPEMIAKMRAINVVVPIQTPQEVTDFIAHDYEITGKLVRDANIKAE